MLPSRETIDRAPRVSVLRLARKVRPPFASVLVQVRCEAGFEREVALDVHVDGAKLRGDAFEVLEVDSHTRQVVVRGESFPWFHGETREVPFALFLDGRPVHQGTVEVAAFQAS